MTEALGDLRAALSLLTEAQAELALPDPWVDRLSRSLADYGAAVDEFAAALTWASPKTAKAPTTKRTKEQWRDVLVKAGKREEGFSAPDLAKELDCGVISLQTRANELVERGVLTRAVEAQSETKGRPPFVYRWVKPVAGRQPKQAEKSAARRVLPVAGSGRPMKLQKDVSRIVDAVEMAGGSASVRGSGHVLLRLGGKSVTLPSTPSDHRSLLNARAQVKRELGVAIA